MSVTEALRRQYRRGGLARWALAVPAALRRTWLTHRGRAVQSLVAELGQRIVGDVTLAVPEFDGRFACSPRSDLFARMVVDGAYEPRLAELFARHVDPQRDIVDVGANIGFYSVLGARRSPDRRVLAIEPNRDAQRRLRQNLYDNGVAERVIVFDGVASAAAGTSDLHIIEGMEEYSSIGAIAHASVARKTSHTVQVAAETLDRLVDRHNLKPGLIKIDVEGAEGLVLAGAQQILQRLRPVVLAEFSPALLTRMGTDPAHLLITLREAGYRIVDAADVSADPLQRAYGDILCLPD